MRAVIVPLAGFALAGAALTDPVDLRSRLVRIDNIAFKHMTYRVATGERIPGSPAGDARFGDVLWAADQVSWFLPFQHCDVPGQHNEMVLDWGDLPAGAYIDGFRIAYVTDANIDPNAVRLEFTFLDNSNGYDNNQGPTVAGFIADLPGLTHSPYPFVGWIITFDLEGSGFEFVLGDQDLDGDGLADFAYTYTMLGRNGGTLTGPMVVGSVDPERAPGAEDAYDLYIQSPEDPCSDPNAAYVYDGTYSFSEPELFAQFFLILYGSPSPLCPGGDTCVAGDVDGDCAVTLADLSALLAAFGCVDGQACYNPAADFDNSGDVGLDDLSSLLAVYGLDCNWPVELVPDPNDPPTGQSLCEWEVLCLLVPDNGGCPPAVLNAVRDHPERYLYALTCSGQCVQEIRHRRITVRYRTADGEFQTCNMDAKLRRTGVCGPGVNTPFRLGGLVWLSARPCQMGW